VVIGGGAIGASAAFHLGEAGVADVVLVEKAELGSGSTSRAAGGVRSLFSERVNVELGMRSLAAYADFPHRPGKAIDLHRVGYLFLLSLQSQAEQFQASVDLQRSLGIRSEMIDVGAAARLSPLIETNGLIGAAWSPDDGYCTPESVVAGYATGARHFGVTIIRDCEVESIDVVGGAIRGVRTTRGAITTAAVICAAGAWSAGVGRMVDVDLPVTPLRRQVVVTEPVPGRMLAGPMTIDASSLLYFHSEGPGLLIGMSDPGEVPGFSDESSDAWLPTLVEAIARRIPTMLEVGIRSNWAGLYEITPDNNALVGEASSVSRFLYATGFSGHGFMQAPAIGEVIRDLYLGVPPPVDVSDLAAERFRLGRQRRELVCV
jgi:sarcosine oxidase subunit beta